MTKVLAAADIGSNTAHLLVASLGSTGLSRLVNESDWLSLGQIVSQKGHIPVALADHLVRSVTGFRRRSVQQRASGLYLFATEAMRRAENHADVLRRIEVETGLKVDLVSPSVEAELGLLGALFDSDGPSPFLLVEGGGGSVQIALCNGEELECAVSLPLGTGVILDRAGLSEVPDEAHVARAIAIIEERLSSAPAMTGARRMVSSGGVARGFLRALHPDGERLLRLDELEYLARVAQRLPVDRLSDRFRVKARRAATLLPGALVYLAIMRRFGFDQTTISEYGVREGAVLLMSRGRIEPCPL